MLSKASIPGLEELRTALRKMCVRGKAVLEARRLAQEAVSRYVRNLADRTGREARGREIEAMASQFESESVASKALKAYMVSILENDLVAAKRDLFVLFHTCCNSLVYRCAAPAYPGLKEVSASMSLTGFQRALSDLAQWGAKQGLSIPGPKRIITTTTAHEDAFGPGWKEVLQTEKQIWLSMPSHLKIFERSYRLRVKNFKYVPAFFITDPRGHVPN